MNGIVKSTPYEKESVKIVIETAFCLKAFSYYLMNKNIFNEHYYKLGFILTKKTLFLVTLLDTVGVNIQK